MTEHSTLALDAVRHAHFVGIGGSGMSGLARLFLDQGKRVTGSDARPGPAAEALERQGAAVYSGHAAGQAGDADLVVVTAAVAGDNPEVQDAHARGVPVLSHADVLGLLTARGRGIAVAGTHGKTTTTALVGFLLERAGLDPTILAGAEMLNYGASVRQGRGPHVVVEADEYDRRFLRLAPQVAIVTSVEADHLDYFRDLAEIEATFATFVGRLPDDGTLVVCADDAGARGLAGPGRTTYGLAEDAGWRALACRPALLQVRDVALPGLWPLTPGPWDTAPPGSWPPTPGPWDAAPPDPPNPGGEISDGSAEPPTTEGADGSMSGPGATSRPTPPRIGGLGGPIAPDSVGGAMVTAYGMEFLVVAPDGEQARVRLPLVGQHNVANALAALAVAVGEGVPLARAAAALADFRGTRRRFELVGSAAGVIVVDDYAHHPTAVRATLEAARGLHAGPLWVVFQPHTRNRTSRLLDEFAAALGVADGVVVTDVYEPVGREREPIAISGADLAARVRAAAVAYVPTLDGAAVHLAERLPAGSLLLTMGAGDVDLLGPMLLQALRLGR